MRVLLTGGSGFIASHCIDLLLQDGHDVVFTVRSDAKGEQVLRDHPQPLKGHLAYVVVPDIATPKAFDEAVRSDPPFDAVLHMASPFHFGATDPQRDMLDPAVIGTTGILESVQLHAPSVKRVVLTSSFVAILDVNRRQGTYSEADWNPITHDEALLNPGNAYRASKTFAEKAAWEFMERHKPPFDLAVINPPLVFGPTRHSQVNTSNQRLRDLVDGKWNPPNHVPPTGGFLWVDVRDVARAHVRALTVTAAGNRRFLVVGGHYSNAQLVSIVRSAFPGLADRLPADSPSDMPPDVYGYDDSRSREILGLEYITLEQSVVDTVRSLMPDVNLSA